MTLKTAHLSQFQDLSDEVPSDDHRKGLSPSGKNISVLIVENNDFTSSALSDFLTQSGMTVDTIASGREALGIMAANHYDLVITDIVMPGMDGLDFVRQIRKRAQDIPIIIITSSQDVNHAIEALRLSVNDYILKPLDLVELETRIALLLMRTEAQKRDSAQRFRMIEKILRQEKKLEDTFLFAVKTLINAIEARDPYTKGHSTRVTRVVDLLLRKLGVRSQTAGEILLAAQLHDTGKLGISDGILNKPAGLSTDERHIMKTHPEVGYQILKPILPEEVLVGILHHHERWDGTGYPMNLAGKDIPFNARIITIADAFDAMITDRKYRAGVALKDALNEISERSGTQFDPELVPPFIETIREHRPIEIAL